MIVAYIYKMTKCKAIYRRPQSIASSLCASHHQGENETIRDEPDASYMQVPPCIRGQWHNLLFSIQSSESASTKRRRRRRHARLYIYLYSETAAAMAVRARVYKPPQRKMMNQEVDCVLTLHSSRYSAEVAWNTAHFDDVEIDFVYRSILYVVQRKLWYIRWIIARSTIFQLYLYTRDTVK